MSDSPTAPSASPVELGLSVVGLLALSVGELRAVPYGDAARPRVSDADWRAFIGRLATAVTKSETTATTDGSKPVPPHKI